MIEITRTKPLWTMNMSQISHPKQNKQNQENSPCVLLYIDIQSAVCTQMRFRCGMCETPTVLCVPLRLLITLQWRYNERDGVSNHRRFGCLLNRWFRRRSKKTKFRVIRLCEGNPPVTSGFPWQMASNAENISIWWRHHDMYRSRSFAVFVNTEYIPRIIRRVRRVWFGSG